MHASTLIWEAGGSSFEVRNGYLDNSFVTEHKLEMASYEDINSEVAISIIHVSLTIP